MKKTMYKYFVLFLFYMLLSCKSIQKMKIDSVHTSDQQFQWLKQEVSRMPKEWLGIDYEIIIP